MRAEIKICLDNAAFAENRELELAGILRDLADKVEAGRREAPVLDSTGNRVGHFRIVGQPRRFAR